MADGWCSLSSINVQSGRPTFYFGNMIVHFWNDRTDSYGIFFRFLVEQLCTVSCSAETVQS